MKTLICIIITSPLKIDMVNTPSKKIFSYQRMMLFYFGGVIFFFPAVARFFFIGIS